MKWHDVLKLVDSEPVFSSAMLMTGATSPEHVRRQINRWIGSGKLVKLRRGLYSVAPPYAKIQPHPFLVANRMKKASYISLQSALSHHGMIPEHVPVTTSVTTGRPEKRVTALGRYTFRHVRDDLFFGYTETEVAEGQYAFLALPEKALLDLLYLTRGSDALSFLRELRMVLPDGFRWERLEAMVHRAGSTKLRRALRRLREALAGEGAYEAV